MIRRFPYILLGVLVMVWPLRLAAQADDSRSALVAIEAKNPAEGGCDVTAGADEQGGHGFDLANLDRSASPCDDFFQSADGGWVKNHPIPAAYPSWGRSTNFGKTMRTPCGK